MRNSLAALLALAALAPVRAEPPDAKQLTRLLEAARRKHDVPALAAAVVTSKGLRVVAATGGRKRGSDTAVTVNDEFHLGSDTKPWTAWLIAWLVERGLLDWDTPLIKVFPEHAKAMSADWKTITVAHLLTHRAGLPANLPGPRGWWSIDTALPLTQQRRLVVERAVALKLHAKPGVTYAYSNLGYTLLGAVAERVGKATWEDQVRDRICRPLGIKRYGFGPMGKAGMLDQPRQHTAKGKPIEPALTADNPPVMSPAGRLHASLPAWAKFIAEELRGLRGGKAHLKAATYARMKTCPFEGKFYCLGGWAEHEKFGSRPRPLLTHDGSNTMNYATAFLIPQWDVAVLVVTNQGGAAGRDACHEVAEQLLAACAPPAGRQSAGLSARGVGEAP